jgi:CspA family cold shock protein
VTYGVVKSWIADRGFGFITPDDGDSDVFVHVSSLDGLQALQVGTRVEFLQETDPRSGKKRACDIRVLA